MAVTNHERVGKALELLRKGLQPFFQREMQAKYGENWLETALQSFKDRWSIDAGEIINWDVHHLLVVMWTKRRGQASFLSFLSLNNQFIFF